MTPLFVLLLEEIDPVELGGRIRLQRRANDMSQGDLAADGCSTAYISRIEGGHRKPSPALLEFFAIRLGVGVERLLNVAFERSKEAPPDYRLARAAAVALTAWLQEPDDYLAYKRMVLAAHRWEAAAAQSEVSL